MAEFLLVITHGWLTVSSLFVYCLMKPIDSFTVQCTQMNYVFCVFYAPLCYVFTVYTCVLLIVYIKRILIDWNDVTVVS